MNPTGQIALRDKELSAAIDEYIAVRLRRDRVTISQAQAIRELVGLGRRFSDAMNRAMDENLERVARSVVSI